MEKIRVSNKTSEYNGVFVDNFDKLIEQYYKIKTDKKYLFSLKLSSGEKYNITLNQFMSALECALSEENCDKNIEKLLFKVEDIRSKYENKDKHK